MDDLNRELGGFEENVRIDFLDYWKIIWKRIWLVAAIALAVLAAAAYKTYSTTPQYTARGTLLIEQGEPNILSFDQVFSMDSFYTTFYQTQYKLLESGALADRVAKRLDLEENPTKAEGKGGEESKPDSLRLASLAGSIQGRIQVSPVKDTYLVGVGFSDPDPIFAAKVVNAVFDGFIEMNIETKYAATQQAVEFLTKQIGTLQSEIDGMEKKLQAYGVEKNIVSLGNKETTVGDKLAEMNKSLTEAQIDTAKKQAYFNTIKNASPDYFPETLSNPLIQKLREDYVALNREYQKKLETYRPEFPEMQRLKSEMDGAKKTLETETLNLIRTADSDYQAALRREKSLEDVFNRQKNTAAQVNSSEISYNGLKAQIDAKRNLLDSLMKRQSETGVSAQLKGVGASNIKILDRAQIPLHPSGPNHQRDMLMGFLMGLMGGVGLAFFLHFVDNSVKTADDVQKYAKLPALGIVPSLCSDESDRRLGRADSLKKEETTASQGKARDSGLRIESIEMIPHFFPRSMISESYRLIRTAILLSASSEKLKSLILTSSVPAEGKTVTAINLGVTLTQAGKKVVIVDADMRKPRQHKIFKIKNVNGLTNYLTSNLEITSVIKATQIPELSLINAGPVPPNPSELLGSEKMTDLLSRLKGMFDYVLVDTPPILAVADALVLARQMDGVILVVWGGKTARTALQRAKQRLDLMGIRTIGVILNRVDIKSHDYYYEHHYYYYEDNSPG